MKLRTAKPKHSAETLEAKTLAIVIGLVCEHGRKYNNRKSLTEILIKFIKSKDFQKA